MHGGRFRWQISAFLEVQWEDEVRRGGWVGCRNIKVGTHDFTLCPLAMKTEEKNIFQTLHNTLQYTHCVRSDSVAFTCEGESGIHPCPGRIHCTSLPFSVHYCRVSSCTPRNISPRLLCQLFMSTTVTQFINAHYHACPVRHCCHHCPPHPVGIPSS